MGSVPRRAVLWPWTFSLALHGLVAALFMTVMFAPAEARVAAERPSIRVALAARARTRVDAPENTTEETPAPEIPQAPVTVAPVVAVAETAPTESAPAEQDPEETAATAPAPRVFTPAILRAAIQDEAAARRSAVTESWITNCWLERKRRGTRDCDAQLQEPEHAASGMRAGRTAATATFATALMGARQADLVESFLEQNKAMQALMEQGGVLATLAAQRYFINRENIWYLTGNGPDPVFAAMGGFHADVLGGPRLQLPGGSPIICADGPCVYKFTGFRIVRPERAPAPNEFRVVPVPFGNQH